MNRAVTRRPTIAERYGVMACFAAGAIDVVGAEYAASALLCRQP